MGTGVHFECTKCGACCREEGLLVTVTGHDIARLSIFLGLSASEMLRALDFYVLPETDDAPIGMRDIPAVHTEHGAAYVAIRKLETNDCIFLSDDLCMIHKARPGVCKSFPFIFHEKNGSTSWGLSAMREICPGLDTGPEITAGDLEDTSMPVLRELSIYRDFASEWNENEVNPTALFFIETMLSDPRFAV
ncbi:MAG: YkgJ family cysteine cluster protein [Candidatus Thorarchaeota archaeon]